MSKPTLPPIQFVNLDTLCQVSGTPEMLSDFGLRSSPDAHRFPLQGPTPRGTPEEALKSYREWLMGEIRLGLADSRAARHLQDLMALRARLAESGLPLTLAHSGQAALPYSEAIARCLDWLAAKGWPKPAQPAGA